MAESADPGPLDHARSWAQDAPDDLALVGPGLELSAAELWDVAERVARVLAVAEVDRGELLAVAGPLALRPALTLGVVAAGAVPLNHGPGMADLRVVSLQPVPGVVPARLLLLDLDALAAPLDGEADLPGFVTPRDATSLAVASSGTTGTPKVVLFTGAQVRRRVTDAPRTWMPTGSVAILLGVGSISGQIGFLTALARRTPHVVPGDAATNVAHLRTHRLSFVTGSPPQLADLLRAARAADERLPDLEAAQSVGSPITAGLAAELADWFGIPVASMYGSTETGGVAVVDDATRADAPARIYPGATVEIVDDDGEPVADGTPGRIRLRTAGMATGYLDDPGRFRDGWFPPGDLGSLDADGLRLFGRADDLINASGIKVMPELVERYALALDGIVDAATVPVTDRHGVARIALALVAPDGLDPDAVATALRPDLGAATPRVVVRVAELPRTETGKLRRDAVAELVQARLGPLIEF
jgi:acyl-coenzyme A synthetase/AMP-(fatty) acid ligase